MIPFLSIPPTAPWFFSPPTLLHVLSPFPLGVDFTTVNSPLYLPWLDFHTFLKDFLLDLSQQEWLAFPTRTLTYESESQDPSGPPQVPSPQRKEGGLESFLRGRGPFIFSFLTLSFQVRSKGVYSSFSPHAIFHLFRLFPPCFLPVFRAERCRGKGLSARGLSPAPIFIGSSLRTLALSRFVGFRSWTSLFVSIFLDLRPLCLPLPRVLRSGWKPCFPLSASLRGSAPSPPLTFL